jgi:hypothetical protein
VNRIESDLLLHLQTLEAEAQQTPRPDLRPRLAALDQLLRELPADADPELRHFLQRRSYEKARLFLEGRSAEIARGGCTRLNPDVAPGS